VGDGVWGGAAGQGDFGVVIHQILFDRDIVGYGCLESCAAAGRVAISAATSTNALRKMLCI